LREKVSGVNRGVVDVGRAQVLSEENEMRTTHDSEREGEDILDSGKISC
jgi:hypothetical protein